LLLLLLGAYPLARLLPTQRCWVTHRTQLQQPVPGIVAVGCLQSVAAKRSSKQVLLILSNDFQMGRIELNRIYFNLFLFYF
jgi:hypothetical protein